MAVARDSSRDPAAVHRPYSAELDVPTSQLGIFAALVDEGPFAHHRLVVTRKYDRAEYARWPSGEL
jgi:hypothetical protein